MPILYEPDEPDAATYSTLEAVPPGLVGPVGVRGPQGANAFNKFLTTMARDVPREARKVTRTRNAIRRLGR